MSEEKCRHDSVECRYDGCEVESLRAALDRAEKASANWEGNYQTALAQLEETTRLLEAAEAQAQKFREALDEIVTPLADEPRSMYALRVNLVANKALQNAAPEAPKKEKKDPLEAIFDKAGFKQPERVKDSKDEIDRISGVVSSEEKKDDCGHGDGVDCSAPPNGGGIPCQPAEKPKVYNCDRNTIQHISGPCSQCQPAAPEAPKKCCDVSPEAHRGDCNG